MRHKCGFAVHITGVPEEHVRNARELADLKLRLGRACLPTSNHTAFHTNDLSAVEHRLNDCGVDYTRVGHMAASSPSVQLFFFDPDGNAIKIFTNV